MNSLTQGIMVRHKQIFDEWVSELVRIIEENILDYSPVLKALNEEIQNSEKRLNTLKNNKSKLISASKSIERMIDWDSL